MDLVTFLRARLDELEAAASGMAEVFDPPWRVVDAPGYAPGGAFEIVDSDFTRSTTGCVVLREDAGGLPADVANYFVRFDPARVLREVAAIRRIIAQYEEPDVSSDMYGGCGDDCEWLALGWALGWVLKLRAAVWSDHPDYDAAWSPDQ